MLFSVCDAAKSLNFVVVVLCPTTVCHCFVVCGIITPCACTRGKAIVLSVCHLSVVTKIARSRVLCIYAYHELVDICEKAASVHFELLTMTH